MRPPVMIALLVLLALLILVIVLSNRGLENYGEPSISLAAAVTETWSAWRRCRTRSTRRPTRGRVYVGICQQNKEAPESCTAGLKVGPGHIRTIDLEHTQAKGPTYARYLCATLYAGEDYFMQIDSHTRFMQGWDRTLVDTVRRCPSAKPVLTHYPHAHTASSEEIRTHVPVMCRSKWTRTAFRRSRPS